MAALHGGRTSRLRGGVLLAAYVLVAIAFWIAGEHERGTVPPSASIAAYPVVGDRPQ
jgi:hypothetical protein